MRWIQKPLMLQQKKFLGICLILSFGNSCGALIDLGELSVLGDAFDFNVDEFLGEGAIREACTGSYGALYIVSSL